jgi:hypothetical protein
MNTLTDNFSQTNPPPKARPAVILGNGPSLRGFDFIRELEGYDTFGMNAAYKYWDRIGWYPTYYACIDSFVARSHKDGIRRLLRNRNAYGIQAFLLCTMLSRTLRNEGAPPCVNALHFWIIRNKFLRITRLCAGHYNVGALSLLWAATLGYRHIILLGIDAYYPVPILPESHIIITHKIGTTTAKIHETPKYNPNYFFDDYQQTGDTYSQTFDANDRHRYTWEYIPKIMHDMHVQVVNANPKSKIDGFPKCTWEEAKYTYNI